MLGCGSCKYFLAHIWELWFSISQDKASGFCFFRLLRGHVYSQGSALSQSPDSGDHWFRAVLGFQQDRIWILVLPFTICVSWGEVVEVLRASLLSSAKVGNVFTSKSCVENATRWCWEVLSPGPGRSKLPVSKIYYDFIIISLSHFPENYSNSDHPSSKVMSSSLMPCWMSVWTTFQDLKMIQQSEPFG